MALGDREVVTLFETLSNVLPRSLFTDLGEPPRASEVPYRVAELTRARGGGERASDRLGTARDGGDLCSTLRDCTTVARSGVSMLG